MAKKTSFSLDNALSRIVKPSIFDRIVKEIDAKEVPVRYVQQILVQYYDGNVVELKGEDSGTWGTITNTNWNLIEQSVAGVQTITMANANYTLSNLNGVSDEARNMVLNIVGTNSGIYQVVAPLVSKFYIISNNTSGGYAITIGASTGSIITVPNGVTVQVYCDGSTGFFSAQTGSAGNFLVNGNFSCTGNEADVSGDVHDDVRGRDPPALH